MRQPISPFWLKDAMRVDVTGQIESLDTPQITKKAARLCAAAQNLVALVCVRD
jgi:hypothetical protein